MRGIRLAGASALLLLLLGCAGKHASRVYPPCDQVQAEKKVAGIPVAHCEPPMDQGPLGPHIQ